MILSELTETDYQKAFTTPRVIYNSVAFTALNACRADSVVRLMAATDSGSPLLGLTVGMRGGVALAPFSAPFACFDFNRSHSADTLVEALQLIGERFPGLHLTLPPTVYGEMLSERILLAATTAGAVIDHIDWNYHLDLTAFAPGAYESILDSPNRKKLHAAQREGYTMSPCDPLRAYEIIRRNRQARGYPLRMTADQVLATTAPRGPVAADFFILTDAGGNDVAASVIYTVAPEIAQVIYWGNDPAATCRNPMNVLAALTAELYRQRGYRVLDIGPSSENGIPNFGLCRFKETIGCVCTAKPSLILNS